MEYTTETISLCLSIIVITVGYIVCNIHITNRNYKSKIIRINNVKVKIVDKFIYKYANRRNSYRLDMVHENDTARRLIISPYLEEFLNTEVGDYGIVRETVRELRNGELRADIEYIQLDEYKTIKGIYDVEDFEEEFRADTQFSEKEILEALHIRYYKESYESKNTKPTFDIYTFMAPFVFMAVLWMLIYLLT
jgi:hypothetical protein